MSHAIVFLVGKETALRDEQIREIQNRLFKDPSARQLNSHFFNAAEDSLKSAADIARTAPFLSEKRLIVLKEIEELDKEEQPELLRILTGPQPFAQWVLTTQEPRAKSPFLAEVAKRARVVSCEPPYREAEIRGWAKAQFQKRKKEIDGDALELLCELCGKNMSELAAKVEQLAVYAGEGLRIARADVEALVGPSLEKSAFDLYEAAARCDADSAFGTLKKLAGDGSRPHEILGALAWRFERNMRIKNLLAEGLGPADVGARLGINRYFVEGEVAQARAMDGAKARKSLKIFLACDGEIKRGLLEPNLALEKCVLNLCSV